MLSYAEGRHKNFAAPRQRRRRSGYARVLNANWALLIALRLNPIATGLQRGGHNGMRERFA